MVLLSHGEMARLAMNRFIVLGRVGMDLYADPPGTRVEAALRFTPALGGSAGNIAVALGNAATTPEILAALAARREDPSALVREHVRWALAQHEAHMATTR